MRVLHEPGDHVPAFLTNGERSSDPNAKRLSPSLEKALDAAFSKVWNRENAKWLQTGIFTRTGDRVVHSK